MDTKVSHSAPPPAEAPAARIRALGARATPARMTVLAILDAAQSALSHHDIERQLADTGFDRVTLYRVLDWLVANGLAHRSTDAERVFRYSAAGRAPHTQHAHFVCEACGRVFCLDAVTTRLPTLPAGYVGRSVELNIGGVCAACTAKAQQADDV